MTRFTLITGSTLGGAEYVADHLSDLLEKEGHETSVINEASIEDVTSAERLLVVTSTHGAGDFPETIAPLMAQIDADRPSLNGLPFAVIAIGDSSYDTFCEAGKKADFLLESVGGKRKTPLFEIDILAHPVPEDAATEWLSQWKKQLCE